MGWVNIAIKTPPKPQTQATKAAAADNKDSK